MVDYFALALSHGLLAYAAVRVMLRDDLDRDPPPPEPAEASPEEPPARPGLRLNA